MWVKGIFRGSWEPVWANLPMLETNFLLTCEQNSGSLFSACIEKKARSGLKFLIA